MKQSIRPALGVMLLVTFLLSSLAGCGFHARGAVALPDYMQKVTVRSSRANSELVRSLKRQLTAAGAEVVSSTGPDVAVLDIIGEGFDRRVLSVGSTGKAQEYEVHYGTTFRVLAPGGKTGLKRQQLNLSRDFVFDEREVLSKESEEGLVRRTLQQDMVRQILLRLQAASGRSAAR